MPALALTFDDGPGEATSGILDLLREHGVKATFFMLGENVERHPASVARAAREGHVIGNHTYGHPDETVGLEDLVAEIERTDRLLREASGQPLASIPFRLPYGPKWKDLRHCAIEGMNRPHTHWTGVVRDWEVRPPEVMAAEALAHIAAYARLGMDAVLCLHDGAPSREANHDRKPTVETVRLVLEAARTQGIRFFTVPRENP
jgi:peptidoglycan/xylan/chitin deacetylase (PgdA/CDA1 family)